MINRRILIFALVGILVLSAVALVSKLKDDDVAQTDDDFEILSSDEGLKELVEDEEGLRKTVMYFQNAEGYLVPVMRKIPWTEGIAKSTLMNMVEAPSLNESLLGAGLKPIIPAGTEVNGMTIDENGLCKVDFNDRILSKETKQEEENLIKGIVYTLTEFPTISEVQISVNGERLDAFTHGTHVGSNLRREDINLVEGVNDARSKVVVYYKSSADGNEHYIPVTIPTMAPMPNVFTALSVLFDGPPEGSNLSSDIPANVSFNTADIHDGVAYVDIQVNGEFPESKDKVIDNILKNVGLTLSEFKEVSSVEIIVDGEMINSAVPVFANEY